MFRRMQQLLTEFCRSESGATAIEYAMIAAGVAAFISATVYGLGNQIQTVFYAKLTALMP